MGEPGEVQPARPFDDPEFARAASAKGAETRKRLREMSPEERALDAIARRLPQLTSELLKAALGEGDFETLKLETRVSALKSLMEWKLGKPASVKPVAPDPETADPDVPEDGNALFT